MADPWQECMDYAVTLAGQAGEVVREALKNEMNIMVKSSPADLVTATDQKVEKMLISSIKEKYPSHSFIGEESVAAGEKSILTDNPTWIIDPIDGTTNFVHGFPFVAVSIGFVVNKKMEFGIVYSCLEDKMYTGRKGKGAFCNGQKLQVSRQEDVTKSLLVTELGSSRTPETVRIILSNMERLLCLPIHGIRGVGTAALNMCLVASGAADAYYEMGIHCWDVAGAGIIVTEAGGVLLDVTGKTAEQEGFVFFPYLWDCTPNMAFFFRCIFKCFPLLFFLMFTLQLIRQHKPCNFLQNQNSRYWETEAKMRS
ncbi:inositol monophosphatase 1 isoform X2 [Ovis aries]|nr:inositol monophosphatase 1 isoform X2 [Ovis aries]XP_060249525.1 inositol monophosphatase 1 isoform X2 [Ovis aries]